MTSVIDSFAEPGAQKSVEWLMERCKLVTASRVKDVIDKLKSGKPGAKRQAYMWEKVTEHLTGQPYPHYESAAMLHGTEFEPQARMAFEARTGLIVSEVGLIHHQSIAGFAGSPDGLIDDDGGCEFKCPYGSPNHLACFIDGMPEEHMAQVQALMSCTGRAYWWFGSYDPRMPAPLDLFLAKVPRDDAYIAQMEAEIIVFIAETNALIEKLKAKAA